MKIIYNSQDENFKKPFGALKCGDTVFLKIKTEDFFGECFVRLWFDEKEMLLPMEKAENAFFVSFNTPDTPQLLWYYFIFKTKEKSFFLNKNGICKEYPDTASYQITVYDKNFKIPGWLQNSVIYQIFPDRFYKKGDFGEKKYEEYYFHKSFDEPLLNLSHPFEDGPALCDFYGGNLNGIREKLSYLKDLGISVIYLNPIFEAYSNHRYDTGNYKKIDSVLGNEEDFQALCKDAAALGIRIILDGVFSHTGADSLYFDKYGHYGGLGAYKNPNSKFKNWFHITPDGSYESWWGCSNLPNVKETSDDFLDYILRDENSVVKKWLRLGASGFRLDVCDELPDIFLDTLRREVKKEKKDAVIIGEVWEDASNKESYGHLRKYLLGSQLDSVMNYPFKELFIGFLTKKISAEDFRSGVMDIMENYPPQVFYSLMNLVSTHDTMRIKTVLGEPYINANMTFEEKQSFTLSQEEEYLSEKRHRLIVFLQMTFPGAPSIYYGDEIGMQGLSDPHNRMPFKWNNINEDLLAYYKKLISIRNSNKALRTGAFSFFLAEENVLAYKRDNLLCILNRGSRTANLPLKDAENFTSLLTGKKASPSLSPFSMDILTKNE